MDPVARYTRTAVALHWLLALMILGSFAVGFYMADLPVSPARLKLINWHKWTGVTILALSALRLLWRLTHRPPADLPEVMGAASPRMRFVDRPDAERSPLHFGQLKLFLAELAFLTRCVAPAAAPPTVPPVAIGLGAGVIPGRQNE